jgi:hypothetical protein
MAKDTKLSGIIPADTRKLMIALKALRNIADGEVDDLQREAEKALAAITKIA